MGGTAAAPTINFLIFGRKRLNSARAAAAAAAGSRLEKGYSPTLFHYTHTHYRWSEDILAVMVMEWLSTLISFLLAAACLPQWHTASPLRREIFLKRQNFGIFINTQHMPITTDRSGPHCCQKLSEKNLISKAYWMLLLPLLLERILEKLRKWLMKHGEGERVFMVKIEEEEGIFVMYKLLWNGEAGANRKESCSCVERVEE
jgi:hypothetical protein